MCEAKYILSQLAKKGNRKNQLTDIPSVHINTAAIHIVKPHYKIDNSCLARAGRTDDGGKTAGLGMQLQILNNGLIGNIGKVCILKTHIAIYPWQGVWRLPRLPFPALHQ